jgi:hypothetical protein
MEWHGLIISHITISHTWVYVHKTEKNIKKIMHTPKTPKMSFKMGYILW